MTDAFVGVVGVAQRVHKKPDIGVVEHASNVIHGKVGLLQFELRHDNSYLDQLFAAAAAGAFLDSEALEAINMANDVKELRRIASEIEALRAKLIANAPAKLKLLQAAE